MFHAQAFCSLRHVLLMLKTPLASALEHQVPLLHPCGNLVYLLPPLLSKHQVLFRGRLWAAHSYTRPHHPLNFLAYTQKQEGLFMASKESPCLLEEENQTILQGTGSRWLVFFPGEVNKSK